MKMPAPSLTIRVLITYFFFGLCLQRWVGQHHLMQRPEVRIAKSLKSGFHPQGVRFLSTISWIHQVTRATQFALDLGTWPRQVQKSLPRLPKVSPAYEDFRISVAAATRAWEIDRIRTVPRLQSLNLPMISQQSINPLLSFESIFISITRFVGKI